MLQPSSRKYRKDQKGGGKIRGYARNPQLCFGDYGIQATAANRLTPRQIEAARRVLTRCFKRQGKIWIRVFPDKPITKKPLEVRQGKGKGSVEGYVFLVKPGTLIFEVSGVSETVMRQALKLTAAKLPFKVRMLVRHTANSLIKEDGS